MSAHAQRSYNKRRKKTPRKRGSEDYLITFAIIIGPLMTLPQLQIIWLKGAADVSLASWIAYLAAAVIWLRHGIQHKDRALVVVQAIWVLIDLAVVIGLIKMGSRLW